MKGYEALAEALVAEGVDTVFGILGNGVLQLSRVLADKHKIRFVGTRHEEVAVGMADGYSRATGKIGVAIICFGPGLANASAPMLAARMSNSRVLVVIGAGFGVDRHNNMSFDQPPLIQATIGAMQQCRTADTLAEDVALSFRHIRLGRGPIALHFPLSDAAMPDGWRYDKEALSSVDIDFIPPRQADIDDVVARIRKAKRPVILGGRGAYLSGARSALSELGERTGALLATTLLTKHWLDGDPYSVGLSGGFSSRDAAEILKETDLLLAFGCSLNEYTFAHGLLYPDAEIVQVDTNPAAIDDYRRADKAVIGDAQATAQALLASLPTAIERPGWRDAAMAERIARIDRWKGLDMTERSGAANPRRIVDAINRLAPSDRILITDVGLFMAVPAAHVTVPTPGDIIFPWQLGRVGCALPVAMGAAMGRPDRLVTVFVGDGGMMAAINALDTLATLKIPLLIVVMDDGGFGAERRLFQLAGQQSNIADYTTPDLKTVAAALGIKGHKVTSGKQMEALLKSKDFTQDANLVHVVIDSAIPTTEMDAAYYVLPTKKASQH